MRAGLGSPACSWLPPGHLQLSEESLAGTYRCETPVSSPTTHDIPPQILCKTAGHALCIAMRSSTGFPVLMEVQNWSGCNADLFANIQLLLSYASQIESWKCH